MQSSISFLLDGKAVTLDFQNQSGPRPTTTVLNYLRGLPTHKGVKEGCAEGDCGACTVVLGELGPQGTMNYKSVDSCLVFLPMIHGKQLVTVEDLKDSKGKPHPVQETMVETDGSQCGFCTPGFVMSLFSLYKSVDKPSRDQIDDALTGNLCRCTGYRPIIEAAARSCVHQGRDHFSDYLPQTVVLLRAIPNESIQIQTSDQKYFRPLALTEALSLKRQHPDALVMGGATDIALRVTKKHELLTTVIDISAIEELRRVVESPSMLTIGAGVALSNVLSVARKDFPALYDMLSVFGSQQIRNLATLGGNLGTASPIGDTLPVLIAYNAKVLVQSLLGRREIPIDEYFIGYRKTARKPDELITAIAIPKLKDGSLVKSYKVSKRKDLDISTVSAGFRLERDGGTTVKSIKLAYGGMAERPKRATNVEESLIGKSWSRENVESAMKLVEKDFQPISDARSSAEFRKIAAGNLLIKFWSETEESRK